MNTNTINYSKSNLAVIKDVKNNSRHYNEIIAV